MHCVEILRKKQEAALLDTVRSMQLCLQGLFSELSPGARHPDIFQGVFRWQFLALEPSSRRTPSARTRQPLSTGGSHATGAQVLALAEGEMGKAQTAKQTWCDRGEVLHKEFHTVGKNFTWIITSLTPQRQGSVCDRRNSSVFKHCNKSLPMASAASGPSTGFCSRGYNERVNESSAPTTHTSLLLLWDLICKNCSLLYHKTEFILISAGSYQTCCTYQLFDTKIKENTQNKRRRT